ncbi:Inosine-uridine preferring nucleoside hydrolase [Marivirga sericea]|uniref:Inosine-uridine preferring nucleoside hydrolase n=1 Tax=Marivirga sericea TaxID=1028 RepID=A0A1X7IPX9_9BACT|nr:nucleoside hydrolase [Marivirga sericea]SMG17115.1 Inosine-uridine preferring nucleoside hydrolase [Marivirga sericea]
MKLVVQYLLVLFINVSVFASSVEATPKKVWIDTDIIFDVFGKDVDDGVALMLALNNPDIEIVGISVVHNVAHAKEVTEKILKYYAEYDIPVYLGQDDASKSYGSTSPAVEALAAALEQDSLAVLALGPATNIANLLKFYPEQTKKITDIVFCAGRTKGNVFRPKSARKNLPDYNFELDSASFQYLLEKGSLNIILAGYEAAAPIFIYKSDLKKLKERNNPGDNWVFRKLRNWHFGWRVALGVDGFIPFDVATVGAIIYPEFFTIEDQGVEINYRENDSYFLIKADKKNYLEVVDGAESKYSIRYVVETDSTYKNFIVNKLFN